MIALLLNFAAVLAAALPQNHAAAAVVNVRDYGAVGDWNGATGTDDTAAIQAAIDAAAAGPGALFIPAGKYAIAHTLRIAKTITVSGAASGGLNAGSPNWDSFAAVAVLVNRSTNQDAILVETANPDEWIGGVKLQDFAIEGNRDVPGATAGNGIVFNGPDDRHVRNAMVENVLVYHARDCGFKLANNTYGFTGTHMMGYRNGGPGICFADDGNHGGVSSVSIFAGWFDLNGTVAGNANGNSALRISAPHAGDVRLFGGFYADSDNGGSGVEVTAAAIDAHLYCDGCHMESNSGNSATLSGGYGHVFSGCYAQGAGKAANGFYINNLPGNWVTTSATIRDCEISRNTGSDFFITSNARNVQLYTQAQLLSSYKIADRGSLTQYLGPH